MQDLDPQCQGKRYSTRPRMHPRLNDVLNMLREQGGRCYCSSVPLEYTFVHSDWRISLERLDNDTGYAKENCVLVACEFNTPDYSRNKTPYEVHGTAQWSRAKVAYVWGPACSDLV